MNKKIIIIGGGTSYHIRNHLALSAIAYGKTARKLHSLALEMQDTMDVDLYLTRMAGGKDLETPEDIEKLIKEVILPDSKSRIVFFNPAIIDFRSRLLHDNTGENKTTIKHIPNGKFADRIKSDDIQFLKLSPTPKIIHSIRKQGERARKDIFLVGFKTTTGATSEEQYLAGLNLLKTSSCNLVLANDLVTKNNMIITPEEAAYHESKDRDYVLKNLMEMAILRSHLAFTRSTVVSGESIPWNDSLVPDNLRKVVDYCIDQSAYKVFNGSTVGHFAVKLNDTTFLTSKRKTNFNNLKDIGLVKVTTDGPDSVLAYGFKPSVGGQSQRIVFQEHPGMDCIVHFHCPMKEKPRDVIPIMSQREYECGSHECGKNTSNGLKDFGFLKAVMLDKHGPNIVFSKNIRAIDIIDFIKANFDLQEKTGGYNL